jgi:hypothetical protein
MPGYALDEIWRGSTFRLMPLPRETRMETGLFARKSIEADAPD